MEEFLLGHSRRSLATGTEYTFIRNGEVDVRSASTRVYSYWELLQLFQQAGFGDCEGYSSLTQEPFRLGSQRLLLVGTKT